MDEKPQNNSVTINLRDGIVSIQSTTESLAKCVETADDVIKKMQSTPTGQWALERAIQ
jgi:hypothetical protein